MHSRKKVPAVDPNKRGRWFWRIYWSSTFEDSADIFEYRRDAEYDLQQYLIKHELGPNSFSKFEIIDELQPNY